MKIDYDKEMDTLQITMGNTSGELYQYDAGPFSALVDDTDALLQISIQKASDFIAGVLTAGVELEGTSVSDLDQMKPSWEDVDSSMISAFKYVQTTRTLSVVFKRAGVYRYFDVPSDVVKGLRKASSKGSFMHSMIIDVYPYEKAR